MNKHLTPEPLWCFKRWSRKPWAVFASRCRFKIGVLSVGMSIILLATDVVSAQTMGADPRGGLPREVHLDTLHVVAPSLAAVQQSLASQTRSIIERKASTPVQTAESVLRLLPAVDVRERAGKSTQTDISIRGGAFDGTMVMLNGINFSDARTGHQSHSLPVDLDIISGIAIVDWAAQPGALSGGVDFRTEPLYPRYLRARLEGGAWGYGYGNLSGAWSSRSATPGKGDTSPAAGDGGVRTARKRTDGGFGRHSGDKVSVVGAASYKRSDGYRYNTDFWNVNAFTMVDYVSARAGRFVVQGGYQQRDWGSNGFYSLRYPDQFEHTTTGLASAKWTKFWGRLGLEATGSFRQNDDRFEMQRGNPANIPFNFHTTYNLGGELAASWSWRRAGVTTAGVNYAYNQMLSTAMGDGNESRDMLSAWLSHRKSWRRAWLAGVANLTETPYGTDGTFNAEAGLRAGRVVSVKGNVMRSMRLPTFTDLFYNVATYHPNPNLKPERALTGRLSVQAAHGGFRAEAATWYRRTTNVIDWEQRTGEEAGDIAGDWYSTQLNRLGTFGVELSATWSRSGGSPAGSERGFLRLAMLNYGYTNSDMTAATGYISKYALDYMRHKASAIVGVGFSRSLTLTLTGSFYDREGSYVDADGAVRGYEPYFLLDGRLSWAGSMSRHGAGEMQLYLDVTNITSTRYFDFGGLPMPRAWISAGVVVTIK